MKYIFSENRGNASSNRLCFRSNGMPRTKGRRLKGKARGSKYIAQGNTLGKSIRISRYSKLVYTKI